VPIDRELAQSTTRRTGGSWTEKDVVLYHLGLGAGVPALDPGELRYVLGGEDLAILPTFALVAAGGTWEGGGVVVPGVDVDLHAVLHASQELILHAPMRASGTATNDLTVTRIWDKGSAALMVVEGKGAYEDGTPWFTARSELFMRGEGGWGGERGPSGRATPPEGEPAAVLERATPESLALVYRLSGDTNPLHADPAFARAAGFDRPILHGLCTFGMAVRAIVDAYADGDPSRVTRVATKFTGVFFPGETLRVHVSPRDGAVEFTATAAERDDAPVLAGGIVEHASLLPPPA
jgi:acyl dehydratase